MNNAKLDDLRQVIADEGLDAAQRKAAADHFISELLGAVAVPADDDPVVLRLTTPKTNELTPGAWSIYVGATTGKPADAFPRTDAKRLVHQSMRLRALLELIVDDTEPRVLRLAACREVLDTHMHPRNHFRMNHYDAERLLAAVKPANAMKWTSSGEIPVERPPRTLSDVWVL